MVALVEQEIRVVLVDPILEMVVLVHHRLSLDHLSLMLVAAVLVVIISMHQVVLVVEVMVVLVELQALLILEEVVVLVVILVLQTMQDSLVVAV